METTEQSIYDIRTRAHGPAGKLPLTEQMLLNKPSGDLFGWTQDAGMGWDPAELGRAEYLILSTMGGVRAPDGRPIALGFHTGHWEVGLLVEEAARQIKQGGGIPFAAYCSDPCDGRTQGTTGMFDSLAYRNDAAMVMRRQIRSLPTRRGVIGVATCDKGHPAMMMALAGVKDLPCVLVPGGVTLPPSQGEDAGMVQTIGARFAHKLITLEHAADMGCKACGTPGGGCQFFGTAATSQVVGEALGMSLPHSALAPSGQEVWRDIARRSAAAVMEQQRRGLRLADILVPGAIRNAMTVHAACGGSTNLLLHIPAVAHAAGLPRPTVQDWTDVNRRTPRLVSVLPNGPVHHPTVRVFLAGGVPEVMLHLRELNLLDLSVLTAEGQRLDEALAEWQGSERRRRFREILQEQDGVDPDTVIFSPAAAKAAGLTSTMVFPTGNIAPEGSVIKATSIDPSLVRDGVYRHTGKARVFTSETAAIAALKGRGTGDPRKIEAGDVLVLAGRGPMGTGMEETYQLTSALKHLPWGRDVALITDARFSGVSTGACIGHVGPEALADGPIGKLLDDDVIEIIVDTRPRNLSGSINLIGHGERRFTPQEAAAELDSRRTRPDVQPDPALPADTRLWAALQAASGGTWGGCVYDPELILAALKR